MATPRLVFEFVQKKDQYNNKDRFYIHAEMPISNLKSNGEIRDKVTFEKDYIALWGRIKHLHDMFATVPNFRGFTTAPSFDVEASREVRVAEFEKFFNDVADLFNKGTDGNPIYLPFTPEGTEKCLTLKLVANTIGDRISLGFPKYVGQGFVERTSINNGKLDTALKFQPKETYRIASAAVPSAPTRTSPSNLPADVQAILDAQK
jgi:hypothetical protein